MNEHGNEVFEILEKSFGNVNSWLTFAEAKNAAIIAFNIAVIAALFSSADLLGGTVVFYCVNIGVCVSIVLSLISFIPNQGNDKTVTRYYDEKDNLLLYTHIAKYTKEDYLVLIYRRYIGVEKKYDELTKMELDYADEITYNSAIALNKYNWLKKALYVDFIIIIGIIALVIMA